MNYSAAVAIALCFCVACFKIVNLFGFQIRPFDVFSLRPSNKAFWLLLLQCKCIQFLLRRCCLVRIWCLFQFRFCSSRSKWRRMRMRTIFNFVCSSRSKWRRMRMTAFYSLFFFYWRRWRRWRRSAACTNLLLYSYNRFSHPSAPRRLGLLRSKLKTKWMNFFLKWNKIG